MFICTQDPTNLSCAAKSWNPGEAFVLGLCLWTCAVVLLKQFDAFGGGAARQPASVLSIRRRAAEDRGAPSSLSRCAFTAAQMLEALKRRVSASEVDKRIKSTREK